MRLIADAGLWSSGPGVAATPAVAALEVSGAVLEWTVDDPTAAARITFTDPAAAEWLWRVIGETGHVAVLAALGDGTAGADSVMDVSAPEPSPEALAPLRRLAVGHWLRRWWPASSRDGIVALDHAVLDGELALLTAAAQDYFADDTLDSDVAALLRLPELTIAAAVHGEDPRVTALVDACIELAAESGLGGVPDLVVPEPESQRRRDDYALAAGVDRVGAGAAAIAGGVDSVDWTGVPPGLFDAADGTVDWTIDTAGPSAVAAVRVATAGPVAGIPVRLRSGAISGAGELDDGGRATLPLVAGGQPVTETQAWDHDWQSTTVTVGVIDDSDEAARIRDRIRAFARARLARPGGDAFLAEILAAESDY